MLFFYHFRLKLNLLPMLCWMFLVIFLLKKLESKWRFCIKKTATESIMAPMYNIDPSAYPGAAVGLATINW
jgi:hypothetical protein